jgi:hypothetical protein
MTTIRFGLTRLRFDALLTCAVGILAFALATVAQTALAEQCAGGTCTLGGGGLASPASSTTRKGGGGGLGGGGGGGGAATGGRTLERDWRTRQFVDGARAGEAYGEESLANTMAPIIGRPDGEVGELRSLFSYSFQINQYPPFSNDRDTKDTEFLSEAAVDLAYPLSERTELTGRVSVRDEWSRENPESFASYNCRIFRFDAGVSQRLGEHFTGSLTLGTYFVDQNSDFDLSGETPESELLYSLDLEYARDRISVSVGTLRNVYGSPDYEGYKLARVDIAYLETNVRVHDRLNLNLRGGSLQFTDNTEDYESVSAVCTYYPESVYGLGLSLGVAQEFRRHDETIVLGGIDWMRPLSERNSLSAGVRYYFNTTTREQEIAPELILGRAGSGGRHGGAIGVTTRWEFNQYDRHSTFLFLRFY